MLPYSPSKNVFIGNGVAVNFPFSFKVWDAAQLKVVVTNPQGVDSEAAGWRATLTDQGGSVAYRHDGAPLPAGWKLAVLRDMPFTQNVDLVSGTRFDPQVIEDQLDQAAAERQQLKEAVDRSIKIPPSDEATGDNLLQSIYEARDAMRTARDAAAAAESNAAAAEQAARGADAGADRAEANANKILTLSVSAHESPNGNVAADYSPDTGMLHLYVPHGPKGDTGSQGPAGIQGVQGIQGPKGDAGSQGPPGQAPGIDVINCGGAARTHITIISAGNAASF